MTRPGLKRLLFILAVIASFWNTLRATEQKRVTWSDCSFVADRDQFLGREGRVRRDVSERVIKMRRTFAQDGTAALASAGEVPQKNFIDTEIFGKMARLNVLPAALSRDEEFVRRIYLDLTGRIPSPDQIRSFLADASPSKRDALIDVLLYSPEFSARWTMWMGDWLQNTQTSSNVSRQISGRNSFFNYIRDAVYSEKSLKDVAFDVLTRNGNNYEELNGPANFAVGAVTPGGPVQDMFDTMLSKTASTFLGLAYYDCLLCHNGRGHLDQISLWGANGTRTEAQQMAAFFSRQRVNGRPGGAPNCGLPQNQSCQNPGGVADRYYQSIDVLEQATGTYDLNTNFGNRPNRVPIGAVRSFTPQYRLGGTPPLNGSWKAAFAEYIVKDPMFSRNIANRLWKQIFNLGLVDPVDIMDPARLDASNPPPAPWTLQPTHPELLDRLAQELVRGDFNLREFLRLLVQSSAYQLSSRYEGDWKIEYAPLFARHYIRRLEGEEVHDAIAKATGVLGNYTLAGGLNSATWAMQLPEPVEPRSNGAVATFMNAFLRGNRDTQSRNQSGSILQQLNLMNDAFVTNRIKVTASPTLQALSKLTSNEVLLDEMFLLFLSRKPSAVERGAGLSLLTKAATAAARTTAIEDLAWVCINKTDFLFSY